eukprot:1968240-Alexandrium_andersonii.AAC.1
MAHTPLAVFNPGAHDSRRLASSGKTYQPGERWPPEACHLREERNVEARAARVRQPMACPPGGTA